ncbi:MAG: methyltransferase domain-containing protein [Caulobacter sp.]|nr:methyltransferase domain-containing protein [Caulobacter sp.]
MSEERDYLLGTHDAEVERLGLQHRVWRPRVLDAWRRAGITVGSTVIDAGAGPGWASLDLAEIVGPMGRVHALERSGRFVDVLKRSATARGLDNIAASPVDLVTEPLPVSGADALWIRWVLAFVSEPAAVLAKLHDALRPGGVAVIHEYLDYGTFSMLPDNPTIEDFKRLVVEDWRASGGDPDVGRALPALLPAAGFRIRSMQPLVETVRKGDLVWQWPTTWGRNYPRHLLEAGKVDQAWADRVTAAFDAAEADPNAVIITPMVLEIIAERI